jgi:hypothetical protein
MTKPTEEQPTSRRLSRDKWQRASTKKQARTPKRHRDSPTSVGYYRDLADAVREGSDHFWANRRVADLY